MVPTFLLTFVLFAGTCMVVGCNRHTSTNRCSGYERCTIDHHQHHGGYRHTGINKCSGNAICRINHHHHNGCYGHTSINRCSGNSRCSIKHYRNCRSARTVDSSRGYTRRTYDIKLQGGPCNFHAYDVDQDGLISKEDMQKLFGIRKETDVLFADLKTSTLEDDGLLELEQFAIMAPRIITECSKLTPQIILKYIMEKNTI